MLPQYEKEDISLGLRLFHLSNSVPIAIIVVALIIEAAFGQRIIDRFILPVVILVMACFLYGMSYMVFVLLESRFIQFIRAAWVLTMALMLLGLLQILICGL